MHIDIYTCAHGNYAYMLSYIYICNTVLSYRPIHYSAVHDIHTNIHVCMHVKTNIYILYTHVRIIHHIHYIYNIHICINTRTHINIYINKQSNLTQYHYHAKRYKIKCQTHKLLNKATHSMS